jgi:hypothetical protein
VSKLVKLTGDNSSDVRDKELVKLTWEKQLAIFDANPHCVLLLEKLFEEDTKSI